MLRELIQAMAPEGYTFEVNEEGELEVRSDRVVTIEQAQMRDPGPSRCPWCKQEVGSPHSSTCPVLEAEDDAD